MTDFKTETVISSEKISYNEVVRLLPKGIEHVLGTIFIDEATESKYTSFDIEYRRYSDKSISFFLLRRYKDELSSEYSTIISYNSDSHTCIMSSFPTTLQFGICEFMQTSFNVAYDTEADKLICCDETQYIIDTEGM